jgi:ABC-type lipoprotein release transport system permease subunit
MAQPRLARMAWRNLWRNRRRTLLTLSAIAFGAFLAVLFTAMQDRSFADMIDMAARLGGGHVVVQHPEYLETPTLTRTVADTDAVRAAAMANPRVHRAVDRVVGQAMVATAHHNTGAFFVAFDPATEDVETLSFLDGVQQGRLLGPEDTNMVVLGSRLAEHLDVQLGDKVVYTTMNRSGEIVAGLGRLAGVVQTGAPSVDGSLVLAHIDHVREVVGFGPTEATQVAVFLKDGRQTGRALAELDPHLPPGVDALAWNEVSADLSGFIAMKVGGARFMELVILVLVAASIFNTLFVSVMERMREFGIMMAIGYSPSQVFRLVLWESLWLGLVGLVVSAVLTIGPYQYLATYGIDLSEVYGDQALEVAGVGFDTTLHVGIFPENVLIIAVAVMLSTILPGLYAAYKASRVVPVETIRLV